MMGNVIRSAASGETATEARRNEVKNERGVCRIQRHAGDRQGKNTVGCGTLVKLAEDQIPTQWSDTRRSFKYAILTAEHVFQRDFDVKNYSLDFRKSETKFKTFELKRAVWGPIIQDPPSGLTMIPLDSHASVFRHGLFKKCRCSVLRYGAFHVDSDNDYSKGVCCHMVADHEDPSRNRSFGVKTHELIPRTTEGCFEQTYQLKDFTPTNVFPVGGAILRKTDKKWSLAGVQLNPKTPESQIFQPRPFWLSSKLLAGKLYLAYVYK